MSKHQYPFRILFTVGRLPFTWVRYGSGLARVRQLAERAILEQHGPMAELKAVERVSG